MLQHVEKLWLLRDDIDAGVRSLDAGKGSEVDMRGVVSRLTEQRLGTAASRDPAPHARSGSVPRRRQRAEPSGS